MCKVLDKLFNLFKKDNKETNQGGESNMENSEVIENISVSQPTLESYNGMVFLLDNGHASTTPGKRSPDGVVREYEFNRYVVNGIAEQLDKLGIRYHIITPEVDKDIALSERAKRANVYCDKYGKDNCLFISVHANAGSNGEWCNARGWSIYTTKGNTKSDRYATIFYEEAEKIFPEYNMLLRKDMSDGDPDYEENFTVLYKTKCPAVLTENFFMDNKIDYIFLKHEEGRQIIIQLHVNAIKRICQEG